MTGYNWISGRLESKTTRFLQSLKQNLFHENKELVHAILSSVDDFWVHFEFSAG